ncbi:MAG: trigger factor [Ignavibacteriaceae bacterium]
MELKINDLSISEREIEITFPYEEIKSQIESEVLKKSKKIQLPGFRRGKVPVSMIKKMYGDALDYEASEKIASDKFYSIAKENHLHPIGQPAITDLKFKPGENLFFKVKYEVMPNLDVKDYTNLEIEIPNMQVKDEMVDTEIKNLLKSNSTNEPAEVIGEDNNFIIDVEIKRVDDKGELFAGSVPENLTIDLSNERVQKEILLNSTGKKVGEIFDFSFTDERTEKKENNEEQKVSETYNYTALIKGIKKIVLPELTEEFIKKITKDKASNEIELHEQIKNDYQSYFDEQTENLIIDKLIDQIVKNNDFAAPKSMVASFLEDTVKNEEEESKKRGYKKFDKKSAEQRLNKFAELEVKWFLIGEAIKKKENITVPDEELNELAKVDAEKTGIALDKLISYYKSSSYVEKLTNNKLFGFLKEKNNIKKVEPDKLSNPLDESKPEIKDSI